MLCSCGIGDWMFDRNLMRSYARQANQVQREGVVLLCLARAGAIRGHAEIAASAATFPGLIDDVLTVLRSRVLGGAPSGDLQGFAGRFQGILGPEDAPQRASWALGLDL
jgi:hypothetical protein